MPTVTPRVYIALSKLHALWRRVVPVAPRLTVQDVLTRRRVDRLGVVYRLPSAGPSAASAYDALSMMVNQNVTAVVLDGNHGPDAIFTQNDFLKRVALAERSPRRTLAKEVGTPLRTAAWAYATNTVESCLEIMAAMRCHHLPILTDDLSEGGQLIAVVSLQELVGLSQELREQRASAYYRKHQQQSRSPSQTANLMPTTDAGTGIPPTSYSGPVAVANSGSPGATAAAATAAVNVAAAGVSALASKFSHHHHRVDEHPGPASLSPQAAAHIADQPLRSEEQDGADAAGLGGESVDMSTPQNRSHVTSEMPHLAARARARSSNSSPPAPLM